jgi:hypothetical protein
VDVASSISSITLTATKTDANATVIGDGVKPISTGANLFTITVTAQDGITELNYIIIINCPVEITEPELPEIVVYPNPTRGELRIKMCDMRYEICDITIYDVFGKKTQVSNLKSQISDLTLDLSPLPSGIYFVNIKTEHGIVSKKIVKK